MDESPARDERRIRIFQIFYDDATEALLDPAFIPLDNRANERPDWAEYWPIRRVLASEPFGDDELVGFFSPRFREKTGLTGDEVIAAIRRRDAEVYSFSPHFELGVIYRNPFIQGELNHAGLGNVMTAMLPMLGVRMDLLTVVCDQSRMIFANYWVAPARLWRAWFEMGERVFRLCERGKGPLADALTRATRHREQWAHPMKVFVIERLVTLLLVSRGLRASWCLDPLTAPLHILQAEPLREILVALEGLKSAYLDTGSADALVQYDLLRKPVMQALNELCALRPEDLALVTGSAGSAA